MKAETTDQPILKSIQRLTADEHRLSTQEVPTDTNHARLSEINVEWINVGTYCASAKPCATPG